MARKAKAAPTLTEQLAQAIIENCEPQSFQEASEIIKSLFAPVLSQMLQNELDSHLGYSSGSHEATTKTLFIRCCISGLVLDKKWKNCFRKFLSLHHSRRTNQIRVKQEAKKFTHNAAHIS